VLTVPLPLGPKPKDILNQFYENEKAWNDMSTAPSCNHLDQNPSWLHWSPSKKNQINDFFADIPPLPKPRKAMLGALPIPGSSDEDSSNNEDGEEDDDKDEEEDEDEDEEEEEEEAEEGDGDIYEDEDDRAKDYDDDPMSGLSGPSLTSGSEYQPSR
jgi:hypothetical protein